MSSSGSGSSGSGSSGSVAATGATRSFFVGTTGYVCPFGTEPVSEDDCYAAAQSAVEALSLYDLFAATGVDAWHSDPLEVCVDGPGQSLLLP